MLTKTQDELKLDRYTTENRFEQNVVVGQESCLFRKMLVMMISSSWERSFFSLKVSQRKVLKSVSVSKYLIFKREMPHDVTVGELYESVKLGILRFYLVSFDLEESEAFSEDLQTSDKPSEKK